MASLTPDSTERVSSGNTLIQSLTEKRRESKRKRRERSPTRADINLKNVIIIPHDDGNDDGKHLTPLQTQGRKTLVTRQRVHGRREALYDQKYHPMDDVTRPANAARHRRKLGIAEPESEEDAPMPKLDDDSSSEDRDEELPVRPWKKVVGKVFREGTRHSRRTSGRPRPLYNMDTHPQDALLRKSGVIRGGNRARSQDEPERKRRKHSSSTPSVTRIPSNDSIPETEDEEETAMHGALVASPSDNGELEVVKKKYPITKGKLKDVSEIQDSTSGAGEPVSPLSKLSANEADPLPAASTPSMQHSDQPSNPLFDDMPFTQSGTLPPAQAAVVHRAQNQKRHDPFSGENGTSGQSTTSLKSIVPIDYDKMANTTAAEESQNTMKRMPVSQVPSFMFSSQASLGQYRSSQNTSTAHLRRQAAGFKVFVDREEPSQTPSQLVAQFYDSQNDNRENHAPVENATQIMEEVGDEYLLPSVSHQLHHRAVELDGPSPVRTQVVASATSLTSSLFDIQAPVSGSATEAMPYDVDTGLDAAEEFLTVAPADLHHNDPTKSNALGSPAAAIELPVTDDGDAVHVVEDSDHDVFKTLFGTPAPKSSHACGPSTDVSDSNFGEEHPQPTSAKDLFHPSFVGEHVHAGKPSDSSSAKGQLDTGPS